MYENMVHKKKRKSTCPCLNGVQPDQPLVGVQDEEAGGEVLLLHFLRLFGEGVHELRQLGGAAQGVQGVPENQLLGVEPAADGEAALPEVDLGGGRLRID